MGPRGRGPARVEDCTVRTMWRNRIRTSVSVLTLLVALLGAAASQLPAQSQFRRTCASLRLRAAPALDAAILVVIPRGARISVSECDDTWCVASYSGEVGYAARRFLRSARTDTDCVSLGLGYLNSQGEWMPSPCFSEGRGPPAGASAQCRDGTYSFSRSRRGTCSHHGGVARWL